MNPRVSRSSALASKATGFPIAKLAALLAVGYTLDELPNDITGTLERGVRAGARLRRGEGAALRLREVPGRRRAALGTEMRAVGESLGLGRTFPEAFLKALEGLRDGRASSRRFPALHPYFAAELASIREAERPARARRRRRRGEALRPARTRASRGVLGIDEGEVRAQPAAARPARRRLLRRRVRGADAVLLPLVRARATPSRRPAGRAVVVLGSGPNRIGQGIEFDYCCVHAAQAFRRLGYEAVLLNSNPETVSTDYDTSDRLYLEPVTLERALDVVRARAAARRRRHARRPDAAPARARARRGRRAAARRPARRDRRGRGPRHVRARCSRSSALRAPRWGIAGHDEEARALAEEIGYPVLVRPHYVLGGRGMRVVRRARTSSSVDEPSLVDEFLEARSSSTSTCSATASRAWVAGILEHVEPAGVHSGDSACVIPAPSVDRRARAGDPRARVDGSRAALGARGLLNLQLAVRGRRRSTCSRRTRARRGRCRSSRRRPGVPLVDHACRLMLGEPLADLGLPSAPLPDPRLGEGGDLPGRPVPGRGRPRAGDALDRRGDGRRQRRPPRRTRARCAPPAGHAARARSGRRCRSASLYDDLAAAATASSSAAGALDRRLTRHDAPERAPAPRPSARAASAARGEPV